MAISITTTDPKTASQDARKTRNVYDNLDNLKAVVHYDASNNIDYVLEASNNSSGKSLENKKLQQIQLDVVEAASNITASSAVLKARIIKNDNSKVSETGFVYWTGSSEASVIGKTESGTVVSPAAVLKGSFNKTVTNLAESTVYYYRAYIKHEYGTNYSKVYQFTTVAGNTIFTIAGNKFSGPAPLTVSLSAINAGGGVSSYAWNLTGGFDPDFTTQSVDYTYLSAGTFTARASAIMANGTIKIATKQIKATGSTNYSAEWDNVLNSSYGSNIAGAYDFRNLGNLNLNENLVAFYKLDNTNDSSGNGNNLTNNGNVPFVGGKIGNCAQFDGAGNNLGLNSFTNSFNTSLPFTVSLWYNIATLKNYFTLIGTGIGGTFNVHGDAGGGLSINNSAQADVSVSNFFTTDSWNHLVVTRDSAGQMRVWKNGVKVYDAPATVSYGNCPYIDIGFLRNYGSSFATDGKIDAVGIWQRALTEGEIASLYNAGNGTEDVGIVNAIVGPDLSIIGNTQIEAINGDGSYNKVSLLLDMEGSTGSTNFIDQSTNSLPVTAFGNTQIVSITGVGSPAAIFNGETDYLELPLSSNFDFGTGDFTIELWFNSAKIGWQTLIARWGGGNAFFIGADTNDHSLQLYVNNTLAVLGEGIFQNQWYHIAAVRSGPNLKLFLNGKQTGSTYNISTSPIDTSSANLRIGWDTGINPKFKGYMDDVRITKGVARYNSNFIPPSGPLPTGSDPNFANVSLLLNMSNLTQEEILDVSEKNNIPTLNGNVTSSTAETNFRSSSIYFDGSGDYLVLEDSGNFTFNNGFNTSPNIPFTIEAWIYPTVVNASSQAIISKDTYGSNYSWSIYFTNTKLGCATHNINSDWQFEVNASIQANTWQHVALTSDGTTQRLFLNGQLLGSKNAVITNAPSKISIGCASWNNPGALYQGYIDDLRITKGVARYTANFTPPAAEFPTTGDANFNKVSLLLRSNPPVAFVDSSSNNFTVTKNGTVRMTLNAPEFSRGNYAVFDGSGDYLQTTMDWKMGVSNEPFTMEFWLYRLNTNSTVYISKHGGVNAWNGTDGLNFNFYSIGNNLYYEFWDGTPRSIVNNAPIPVNKWTHLAVVYNGSITTIFVDGIVQPSTSNSGYTSVPSANTFEIGSQINGSFSLNGFIDDLRITKGVARYSSNFIPPQTLPITLGDIVGLKFVPAPSYAETIETVPTTFPFTMAMVGKVDALNTGSDAIYLAAQSEKWAVSSVDQIYLIFSRPFQGLMPNNGVDNQVINYTPDNTEWFFMAASWRADGTVRYYLKSPSQNNHGTVTGNPNSQSFNSYFGFGRGGAASSTSSNINGTMRVGMFINQSFNTQADMENLYNDIISGPVTDLGL